MYPPTTSESSAGDSSSESSAGPSRKRCWSPAAIVTSFIHASRALVFRSIGMLRLGLMHVLVMEVDVRVDVEEKVEDEVESSDRGTMEVRVDVVAEIDILMRKLRRERELEARSLIAGGERASLLEQNGDDDDNGTVGGNGNENKGGNRDRNGRGNRNGNRGGNVNGNANRNDRGAMPGARECTYHNFVKCQPLNFKGTGGVAGLTRWFERMETIFHINNCPERLQDAVRIANDLMDQKLKGYDVKNVENKRRAMYCEMREVQQDVSYAVELADGRVAKTNTVLRGSLDWLANHHAVIVYDEKIVRIPYGDEVLIVQGKPKNVEGEGRLRNVAIVRYFPKVFPEYLPGLPPTRKVKFQIDFVPGVAPNRYPLSRIDNLFDQLQGSRVYFKIGLRSSYHQLRVWEEDIPKITFRTRYGYYEFQVMSFGLTNAPVNNKEHEEHLRLILRLLKKEELYAKFSKCDFWISKLQLLVMEVTTAGYISTVGEDCKKYSKSLLLLVVKFTLCLEEIDLETAQTTTTAKLPILKQGEYDMWRLRIEQYFQVQDYALWDIIKKRNSFKRVKQQPNVIGTQLLLIPVLWALDGIRVRRRDVPRYLKVQSIKNDL
ncbi:hypothetical protein Tco_0235723 [Tanacetum coccineum]